MSEALLLSDSLADNGLRACIITAHILAKHVHLTIQTHRGDSIIRILDATIFSVTSGGYLRTSFQLGIQNNRINPAVDRCEQHLRGPWSSHTRVVHASVHHIEPGRIPGESCFDLVFAWSPFRCTVI